MLKSIALIALITAMIPAGIVYSQSPAAKKPKQVYVIDRDGVAIKQSPDSDSEIVYGAKFGEQLNVIKSYKTWIEVAVPRDDKVGYVQKSVVGGDETKIPLTDSDLAGVYHQLPDDTITRYPNFELKLISKKQFYAMKKTAINYFVADANLIKKHGRTIRLPLRKGFKVLVDQPDDNKVDSNTNSYVGQYPVLNKYLIVNSDGAAEEYSYNFIDKSSGKTDHWSFGDFPYLSINKKFIISIYANDYENYADLCVEKLSGKTLHDYANGQFTNWMPAQSKDQFWGSDNCFYLPVIPSVVYSQSTFEKKPPGYNYRYIKIKIKGPTILPKEEDPYYHGNDFDKNYGGKQVKKDDSIINNIVAHTSYFQKVKMPDAIEGARFAYWKGDELQYVDWVVLGNDFEQTRRYFYLNNKVICITFAAKKTKSQKVSSDDKFYFEDDQLTAWLRFNKPISPASKIFQKTDGFLTLEVTNWPGQKH